MFYFGSLEHFHAHQLLMTRHLASVQVSNTRRGINHAQLTLSSLWWRHQDVLDESTKPVKLHGTPRKTHVKSNIHPNSAEIPSSPNNHHEWHDWHDWHDPTISRWDIAQRIVDVLALRPCTLDRRDGEDRAIWPHKIQEGFNLDFDPSFSVKFSTVI